MIMFAAALPALIFATAAMAAPADCIQIPADLDRLACYDKAAGRTPAVSQLPSSGKWSVSKEKSKMTDQENVFAIIGSDEEVNCGWNRGDKINLVIRCVEHTTSIYFSTGCHMTSSEYNSYGDIEYRIDDQKSKKVSGDASTNSRALGMWNGSKSIPIIKELIGKSRLTARMTPYNESPFTVTYSLYGVDDAVKQVREACKW